MSFKAVEAVLEHSQSRGTDRLVLVVIAECANHEGAEAWPAVERIASRAGTSRRSVFRSIATLTDLGELHVDYKAGPRGTNRYRISLMEQLALDGATHGTVPDSHGAADGVGTVPPVSPEPSLEPSKKKESSSELSKEVAAVFDFWKQTFGKNGSTKLTEQRKRRIQARLRDDGESVDRLRQAVTGCSKSQWHLERGYTDIELICRDAPHVDRFIHLAAKAKTNDYSKYDSTIRN